MSHSADPTPRINKLSGVEHRELAAVAEIDGKDAVIARLTGNSLPPVLAERFAELADFPEASPSTLPDISSELRPWVMRGAAGNGDAVHGAGAVILALRFTVLKGVMDEIAGPLTGKLVVLPSNPLTIDAHGNLSIWSSAPHRRGH